MSGVRRLEDSFIHLGLGARAIPLPEFDGMNWYERYGAEHGKDGAEGRLVSLHSFSEGWSTWEMHPNGEEVVLCIEGSMTLTQEFPDGRRETLHLAAGEYAINPPKVWHIADVDAQATALFITSGEGTEMRERSAFPVD
ncbi:cupin domain-containing protein [Altererythrobacter lutimaris]|uniref:Cupin n=1 Tax=Altererythrobacter lutimaris TaxID=2743979 RepID=A0A850HCC9_9SPHN|nr:cupin [Altererythrobacter lutimaris]NVE95200.1 cupin [Altererythrobacter lutimaris]